MTTLPVILSDVWNLFAGLGSTALVLIVIASIFWVWAIVDCATNPRLDGAQKIVWLLVIFFLHLLGAIIYAVAGRSNARTLGV